MNQPNEEIPDYQRFNTTGKRIFTEFPIGDMPEEMKKPYLKSLENMEKERNLNKRRVIVDGQE